MCIIYEHKLPILLFVFFKIEDLDVDKLAEDLEEIVKPMQEHFSYRRGAYYNHALFFLSIAMHKVMPLEMKKVKYVRLFQKDIFLSVTTSLSVSPFDNLSVLHFQS